MTDVAPETEALVETVRESLSVEATSALSALTRLRSLLLRAEGIERALREARPYVFNRILPSEHPEWDWRSETAESILATVDAALATPEETKEAGVESNG